MDDTASRSVRTVGNRSIQPGLLKMAKTKMKTAVPLLTAAAICEKVLVEKDDVVTAVRIVDRLTFNPDFFPRDDSGNIPLYTDLTLLLILKSGKAKGRCNIAFSQVTPSGQRIEYVKTHANFLGDDLGVNIRSPLPVRAWEEGLHWYEVRANRKIIAQIPLRIVFQRTGTPETKQDAASDLN